MDDDIGSGWFQVKKKHRSSSKFLSQRDKAYSCNNQKLSSQLQCCQDNDPEIMHDGSSFPANNVKIDDPDTSAADTGSSATFPTQSKGDCGNLSNVAGEQCKPIQMEVEVLKSVVIPTKEAVKCEVSDTSSLSNSAICDSYDCEYSVNGSSQFTVASLHTVEMASSILSEDFEQQSKLVSSVRVDIDSDVNLLQASSLSDPSSSSGDLNSGRLDAVGALNEEIDRNILIETTTGKCPSFPEHNFVEKATPEVVFESVSNHCCTPELSCEPKLADRPSVSPNVNNGVDEMTATSTGVARDGTGVGSETTESKERFRQRLWCFLFENLNRAIDELYLLCEVECDMEQINEAMLVLEEANSDFQKLKTRAEHFDNTKKTSSLLKDGISMTVKTDHKRPHALSWEVRRMTTSAQKAEILSSSLEAFKKIHSEIPRIDSLVVSNSSEEVSRSTLGADNASLSSKDRRECRGKSIGKSGTVACRSNEARQTKETVKLVRSCAAQNGGLPMHAVVTTSRKYRNGPMEQIFDSHKFNNKRYSDSSNDQSEKVKFTGTSRKISIAVEKEKEKDGHNAILCKSMDAWKEKRNWEDILRSPMRSSGVAHSPGVCRKAAERARVLHDKLMSPEKKRRTAVDMKREAEEKHARAMRIRNQLESERVQRLQRTSEKLSRVNEWQIVRSSKMRAVMDARHQRGESRHEAYLAQVARRAGDETIKVNEVRFITSLNEENKKLILKQKLHDSEMRRAEKLQVIKIKQKEDIAREEAVLERRRLLEAEKLQRIAETQRKKEEAQIRREEERKASSAAREARAAEQLRRKEMRAKAQQEEAELLAQRLSEKLRESEQRRKCYLEQIREKASMEFRDQSSPFQRRFQCKDGLGRSAPTNGREEAQANTGETSAQLVISSNQSFMKKRIKKIRQKLMALKHEFVEPPVGSENLGVAYRAAVGAARAKIGRWLQDLQRLRQARKEGVSAIGLVISDIIKCLEGKEVELHASRQVGMLGFVASALPASHTSKPEACQVTVSLLRLLRVLLSQSANRSYFLVQNHLPPIIPMLSVSLENYIKVAASCSPGTLNLANKMLPENLDAVAEILDGFLWTVTIIVGHTCHENKELQMQDGLVELIIEYRVIQYLGDLFALYERPQVEGSPFSPIILSGLNLLAVLTSRPVNVSHIDWDSCKCKTWHGKLVREYGYVDPIDMAQNAQLLTEPFGHNKLPYTLQNFEESNELICCEMVGDEVVFSSNNPSIEVVSGDSLAPNGCVNASEFVQDAYISSGNKLDASNEKPLPYAAAVADLKDGLHQGKKIAPWNTCSIDSMGNINDMKSTHSVMLVLSAIAETSLVSVQSLLTAVLFQANKSSSEQALSVLPSNFEEVATGVLKVLNNIACLDIAFLQSMLARSDLQMEFFHLISYILSHCASKWNGANDQVGLLLIESLLLLAQFSLFNPGNQEVLRWGKSPTILHKVCDLPFELFSDPKLMPLLASTLLASCYGCNQNKFVVQQELSTEMILPLLKSCRTPVLSSSSHLIPLDTFASHVPPESGLSAPESSNSNSDNLVKPVRRNARPSIQKSSPQGNLRVSRTKPQRDVKMSKNSGDWNSKQNSSASGAISTMSLHLRYPSSFLDKVEEFFLSEIWSPQYFGCQLHACQ